MDRVYFDHAATTPMVPAAVAAMTEQLGRAGNASSLHSSGRAARRVVEEAREVVAAELGARPAEVIFTSGATEADNLAVKGAAWAHRGEGRDKIICSAVEHHAVLDVVSWLGQQGARTEFVPVDDGGRVELDALSAVVDDSTAVVSVMSAINEVGTRQPLDEVVVRAQRHGALVHSDATQSVGPYGLDFTASGLDLASVSAHKLGGPYGIGALLARRETALTPLLHGGGQEREVRSGTVDVPAVAGFAGALRQAGVVRAAELERLRRLRRELEAVITTTDPAAVVYGPDTDAHGEDARLPGLLTVGFPGTSAEAMLLLLDSAGIDVTTGSACSAGVTQPSHVLLAMGVEPRAARETLRFSLGHTSSPQDVTALAAVLPQVLERARAAAAYG